MYHVLGVPSITLVFSNETHDFSFLLCSIIIHEGYAVQVHEVRSNMDPLGHLLLARCSIIWV